jgi:TonB family protein
MKLSAVLILLFFTVFGVAQAQSPTQAPPAPDASKPLYVAPEAAAALAEKKVAAVYPEKARAAGTQGTVVLDVTVSEAGDVKEASITSGDPDLAQAAIDSIKQWKYKPYIVNGEPTLFETQVAFGFHIKPPPPQGRFRDGKYENEFFEISYPLSTEWVRETNLVRKQLSSDKDSLLSAQVLLAALHVPSSSDDLVADASFVVEATPLPAQSDAKDYLIAVAAKLSAEKTAKQRGEVTQLTIAGLNAYRADFKPSNSEAQYQSIICTMAKGYLVRWNFLAMSESALDAAVSTVSLITKFSAPSEPTKPPAESAEVAEAAQASSPKRMRVSSGVTAGLLIKRVEPKYPPYAKAAHIQGTVLLHAIIDKEGNVVDLEVVSGPIELVPPTVNAVRLWKYRPYLLKGEPIELDTTVQVNYEMRGY